MQTVVEVIHATKKFKDTIVFEDINVRIQNGESCGFVGYNGCGKSVFFKTLCGFSLLSSGNIRIRDKLLGTEIDFIDDTGVIIESPEFIPDLSGFQNLKILADIQKKITPEDIHFALEQVGLSNEKDKRYSKYSLGMKQKLRLAQAIMEKPSIMILDEPMNGLDKSSVLNVRALLKKYVENGGTLLMTSHNSEDIDCICNTVYEFDSGKLTQLK